MGFHAPILDDPRFTPLPREFFARDADVVGRDLLGRFLVKVEPRTVLAGKVVECEAYFGPPTANPHVAGRDDLPKRFRDRLAREGDPAAHSYRGPTERNRVMFGEAGHAYVYFIYGAHECVNVSTGRDTRPQAVLVRALEPVAGERVMERRRLQEGKWRGERGGLPPTQLASGPGKLTQALGIARADNGRDLTGEGAGTLFFAEGEPPPPSRIGTSTRIGVVGAEDYPLRFFIDANPHVSVAPRTKSAARERSRKA